MSSADRQRPVAISDQILNAHQAADYLGVTLDYVRRVIRYEVDVIQRHPRGRLLFRRSQLDRWADANTHRSHR